MARKIKIDNALQKRFSQKKPKIQKPHNIIAYILIVCEGEKTEPNYFKAFPKQQGTIIYELNFGGGAINTLKVVEEAIRIRDESSQKYDSIWAVFDKDSFPDNDFNNAIFKAKANDISCAWSNEAFELWYLLHFHNRTTPMSRTDYQKSIENAVENAMINNKKRKKNQKNKNFQYEKNSVEMFEILEKYGNQSQAISWAKQQCESFENEDFATHNPATKVYGLVEQITGKSEEFNQKIMEKFEKGE